MAVPGVEAWVAAARDGSIRELRQAVHTVLLAVAMTPALPDLLALKGGILLALAHEGDRYTRDIDFSLTGTVSELDPEQVVASLRDSLSLAVQELSYGLDCRIQRHALKPPDLAKTMQTLKLNVGYAPLGDRARHAKLSVGQAVQVLSVDISYNEIITGVEVLRLPGGRTLRQSTLVDLVAEKFRAMLQQPTRNRVRRQDAYDLYRLVGRQPMGRSDVKVAVLEALVAKCHGRDIEPARAGLANPEVRRRSAQEYQQLAAEIESALPPFDKVYGVVQAWYEGLPWP